MTEKGSANEDRANNNSDVLADIDSFCASDKETKPLVKEDVNWMTLAKKLSRKEKESISERFSAELRLLSTGEWLIGIWVTMIYEMLLQVLLTVRKLLLLREKPTNKVRNYMNNHQGHHDYILKDMWVIGRLNPLRAESVSNFGIF